MGVLTVNAPALFRSAFEQPGSQLGHDPETRIRTLVQMPIECQ
jgi:hypothetical protein